MLARPIEESILTGLEPLFFDTELSQIVVEPENPELAMIDQELKQPQPSDLATAP